MHPLRRARDWYKTSASPVARWLRAAREALLGEMPVLAAGTALFAIIATVPILASVVAVLGIAVDAHQVHSQLRNLQAVLPAEVVAFIGDQLERQAARSHGELGITIATSTLVAVYSARGAARALITGLNRAYRVREQRKTLQKIAISLLLALGTILGLLVMFTVVIALPAIVALVGLRGYGLVHWIRWPILMGVLFVSLLGLYRYGPSPRPLGTERHLWPGAAFATVLLVLVSAGLSVWVGRVATYELFYGAFGSVIVILLWFYFSTIALLLGGFVNAELERHAGAPDPDRSMY